MHDLLALGGDASHFVDFLNFWRQMLASTTLFEVRSDDARAPKLRGVALLLQMRPWLREAQLEKDIKGIALRLKHLDNRQPEKTSSRKIKIKEMVAKAMSEWRWVC